jgi:para-nitrobenzyl esterase
MRRTTRFRAVLIPLGIGALLVACSRPPTQTELQKDASAVKELRKVSLTRTPGPQLQSAPVVNTNSGDIQGALENNILIFKGVPYARPPVGDLRWRAPQPATPWQGVRKTDAYGNACIQIPGLSIANGGDPGTFSEDCLYLNVWTPLADPSAKLPVMVWIHGGAFIFGAGGLDIYDGTPLAAKGAVVVSLNYRLAQLGFFSHPALERERPGGPVNFGLLDQISALKWIQQNIARFGGDPGNVTIFGQSAGAKSVLALFASPLARGLFRKGIAMSSYALPDATRAKAVEIGSRVADAVGLKGAEATAAELRAVPAEKFGELKGQEFSLAPVPVGGDEVLPQSVQDTFAAGKEAKLPLILGNTSDDTSVVSAFGFDPAKVIAHLRSARIFVKLLYPGIKDDAELGRQATRDLIFTMPARWIADRHAKLAPSWRYYFDYTAVGERSRFPNGVPHGSDIIYAFDTVDMNPRIKATMNDEDREYARLVSGYWFEFARSGKPSVAGAPAWRNDRIGQDETMIFGKSAGPQKNFMRARLNILIGGTKILGTISKRK